VLKIVLNTIQTSFVLIPLTDMNCIPCRPKTTFPIWLNCHFSDDKRDTVIRLVLIYAINVLKDNCLIRASWYCWNSNGN